MQPDWKIEIARLVRCKQVINDRDAEGALPWHLPAVGASEDRIGTAQASTGIQFPEQYRRLLAHADGWRGFYVLVDLFGTADLIGGRADEVLRRPEVTDFLAGEGLAGNVIAIGGSDQATDVFLLVSSTASMLPGGVIWWAGEEIDRFADVAAFFAAMIAYNERIAAKLAV